MTFARTSFATLVLASLTATAAAQELSPLPGPARFVQPATNIEPAQPASVAPLPLSPPNQAGRLDDTRRAAARPSGGLVSTLTMFVSLGLVVGVFLLVAWVLKRGLPVASRVLPRDVADVLGRVPLSGRQYAHLVRCGNKLVLVALHANGADTITEVTDPAEVERLTALCQSAAPSGAGASFLQSLAKLGRKTEPEGVDG